MPVMAGAALQDAMGALSGYAHPQMAANLHPFYFSLTKRT